MAMTKEEDRARRRARAREKRARNKELYGTVRTPAEREWSLAYMRKYNVAHREKMKQEDFEAYKKYNRDKQRKYRHGPSGDNLRKYMREYMSNYNRQRRMKKAIEEGWILDSPKED